MLWPTRNSELNEDRIELRRHQHVLAHLEGGHCSLVLGGGGFGFVRRSQHILVDGIGHHASHPRANSFSTLKVSSPCTLYPPLYLLNGSKLDDISFFRLCRRWVCVCVCVCVPVSFVCVSYVCICVDAVYC